MCIRDSANLLCSTLSRVWRHYCLVLLLWIIFAINFELVQWFTGRSILSWLDFAFVTILFVTYGIQISFSTNTGANVVLCRLALSVLESAHVIHHAVLVIPVHQILSEVREKILNLAIIQLTMANGATLNM